MNRVLTDEQRALVERNHHVIYCVAKRIGIRIDEIYGAAAVRLCMAALSFRGEPEKFFWYAYVAVRRAVLAEICSRKRCLILPEREHRENAETRLFVEDYLANITPYLTQKEMAALNNVLEDKPCTTAAMAAAKHRALEKCRRLMNGECLEPAKERYSKKLISKAVNLRAHGYKLSVVSAMTGVPERTIREYYRVAGKPLYRTSADIARLLDVDRSTVLRHATDAVKVGNRWEIRTIPKIRKPSKRHSKSYTECELSLMKTSLPDWVVAQKIGRTANAVHIKRWRMRNNNENHHAKTHTAMQTLSMA